MSDSSLGKMVVVAVGLVCISAGLACADKLGLQEKLSKEVKIQLNDVTIAEALDKIGQKAGVKFVLSDEAAWRLPYGEATRLSVALAGPLADSMTEMLNAFFMRYAVGDEEITIYPRPELAHILGRANTRQLEILNAVYTQPISLYKLDDVQTTINEALRQEVLVLPVSAQAQINDLLRQLVGKKPISIYTKGYVRTPPKPEPKPEAEDRDLQLPTPVTLAQLLSQVEADDRRLAKWYISGAEFGNQRPEIRVVSGFTFAELRLGQKVDVLYVNESLDIIFGDLANRAGAKLIVHPRFYLGELSEHSILVNMQNITIEQAVRNIADIPGAECDVDWDDRGGVIEIEGPGRPKGREEETEKGKSGRKAAGDGYVGKISIPMDDGKYYIEFMLREDDLTEELRKLREKKMEDVLGRPPKPEPSRKNRPGR